MISEFYRNIGSQAMLSGDFGESFVAYLLSKEGINVVRASTVGFDLFVIDRKGKFFPKNKIIGISVKARISKSHNKFVPTIPVGSSKINSSMKIWGIDSFIALVIGSKDKKFDVFLVPFSLIKKLGGGLKRSDVVSVSKIYKHKNVIKLF